MESARVLLTSAPVLLLLILQYRGAAGVKAVLPALLESVNGSSTDIGCSNNSTLCSCSYLTDGVSPDITPGSPDWASQLVTVRSDPGNPIIRYPHVLLTFVFDTPVSPTGIEIDLFNCPDWNIGAPDVRAYLNPQYELSLDFNRVSTFASADTLPQPSCDSLSTVTIAGRSGPYQSFYILVSLAQRRSIQWVHVGEVRFIGYDPDCQSFLTTTVAPSSTSVLPGFTSISSSLPRNTTTLLSSSMTSLSLPLSVVTSAITSVSPSSSDVTSSFTLSSSVITSTITPLSHSSSDVTSSLSLSSSVDTSTITSLSPSLSIVNALITPLSPSSSVITSTMATPFTSSQSMQVSLYSSSIVSSSVISSPNITTSKVIMNSSLPASSELFGTEITIVETTTTLLFHTLVGDDTVITLSPTKTITTLIEVSTDVDISTRVDVSIILMDTSISPSTEVYTSFDTTYPPTSMEVSSTHQKEPSFIRFATSSIKSSPVDEIFFTSTKSDPGIDATTSAATTKSISMSRELSKSSSAPPVFVSSHSSEVFRAVLPSIILEAPEEPKSTATSSIIAAVTLLILAVVMTVSVITIIVLYIKRPKKDPNSIDAYIEIGPLAPTRMDVPEDLDELGVHKVNANKEHENGIIYDVAT